MTESMLLAITFLLVAILVQNTVLVYETSDMLDTINKTNKECIVTVEKGSKLERQQMKK